MGNQGHSGGNYFQFKSWVESGVIKDVTRITAHMNSKRRWHGWGSSVTKYPSEPLPDGMNWDVWQGPSNEHPFSDKLHPQEWRSWFDYGSGAFGDCGFSLEPSIPYRAFLFSRMAHAEDRSFGKLLLSGSATCVRLSSPSPGYNAI